MSLDPIIYNESTKVVRNYMRGVYSTKTTLQAICDVELPPFSLVHITGESEPHAAAKLDYSIALCHEAPVNDGWLAYNPKFIAASAAGTFEIIKSVPPLPSGSQIFAYTGAPEEFVVPEGVTEIFVDAYGGDGEWGQQEETVARGARVQSLLSVTPGETLRIRVGGRGDGQGVNSGGYNGGGDARFGPGGGATDIRQGGDDLVDRILVAGGAGGSGSRLSSVGGSGGDPAGHPPSEPSGYSEIDTMPTGATLTDPGIGGNGIDAGEGVYHGSNGSLGQGGGNPDAGGGGGGGYYGGGQGSLTFNEDFFPLGPGGGGGSSYSVGPALFESRPAIFSSIIDPIHTHGSLAIYWGHEIPDVELFPGGIQIFNFTGAPEEFIVPVEVEEIFVDAVGASGIRAVADWPQGGLPARVQTLVSVAPDETLRIRVGGGGLKQSSDPDFSDPNNYNGGGGTGWAKGGGGTDIRQGGDNLEDRIVVAGGGGGTGDAWGPAGWVGGQGGQSGTDGQPSGNNVRGRGATQSAGGAGGTSAVANGQAGSLGQGGDGGSGGGEHGGGGGGGYYGGGGGAAGQYPSISNGAGGGGSSYSAGTGTTFTTGYSGATWGLSGSAYAHGRVALAWGWAIPEE